MPRMRYVPTIRIPRSSTSSRASSATFRLFHPRKPKRRPAYSPRISGSGKNVKFSLPTCLADWLGSDPRSVVQAAREARDRRRAEADKDQADPFDEVWVVFDTEGPQNLPR